ncbi:olfactory receptor 11A1-like [Discoglossus pictus]
MTIGSCISQLYFFGASTITECCLLTVMSYDRYLAICKPLHYTTVMDFRLCLCLVTWSWMMGFIIPSVVSFLLSQLQFCGPFVIDHFFCDLTPILDVSCSDTSIVEIETTVSSIPLGVFQFIFIIVTYILIAINILKISSNTGRQKAFATCSSHLTVVCTYYATLLTTYMVPSKGQSRNINKILSLLYTVLTPLFNPIIYSFRSQEIRSALKHILHVNRLRHQLLS